jgi:BMFP domain-containing protein YqiC
MKFQNLAVHLSTLCLLVACGNKEPLQLAATATASALQSAAPQTAAAVELKVKKSGTVTFIMEAPIEKIFGKVPESLSGNLFVDVTDLSKTTGNIAVDLSTLDLVQRKRPDDKSDYGEEKREEKQNLHAREWLEIDEKVPEEARNKNKRIEFRITSIKEVSKKDVSKETGDVAVTVVAEGEFLLHQRVSKKTVELEATISVEGGKPKGIKLKTKKPFAVDLPEHGIGPRDDIGKVLKELSSKVGREAKIDLDLQLAP